MASTTLYPPIVDSYTPAFIADTDGKCRIYYSLSKFSSSVDSIKSIHFNIVKQSSGESVVNRQDDTVNKRYRSAGILIIDTAAGGIINPVEGQDNLYYTEILASDIKNTWTQSWIYKIQVRFSKVAYEDSLSSMGQAAWLNTFANEFSEWSTYTITKAIGKPEITIPAFSFNSAESTNLVNADKEYSFFTSTLELTGSYNNSDASEILYSYRMKLKDENGKVLEDTDIIYANQFVPNQFYYLFKTEFDDSKKYTFELEYETLNKYTNTIIINFETILVRGRIDDIVLITAEDKEADGYLSINSDEECGRIGLKLYTEHPAPYFGNICIRRADSRTNFMLWNDILITPVQIASATASVNDLEPFYDYTAESGVWYKYGIQFIDTNGFRSALVEHEPIKREYAYSFLLGENNKQLRLLFDNKIGNVKTNFSDSKVNTIGGQYPFITRNGNMKYKTFSINGLISFNMDNDDLFTNMLDIYSYEDVVKLYKQEEDTLYDYTYERDFRNKVLDFLQDGKPKLFKSPTEGNIIIRLMDVNTTPNETLGRLIYNFSATANEIADANIENYLDCKFFTVGNYSSSLVMTETRLGQLELSIALGTDILTEICNKYNNPDIMGTKEEVVSIGNIVLEFESPSAYLTSLQIPGYEFAINQEKIKLTNGSLYDFGEQYTLVPIQDKFYITQAGANPVDIILNFTYQVCVTPIEEVKLVNRMAMKNIGQFSKHAQPSEKIYEQIYYSYFYDWDTGYQELTDIKYATIEADSGAVFSLLDEADMFIGPELHIINETGVLNLDGLDAIRDIVYVGMVDENGNIDKTISTDVIVDYYYYLIQGTKI